MCDCQQPQEQQKGVRSPSGNGFFWYIWMEADLCFKNLEFDTQQSYLGLHCVELGKLKPTCENQTLERGSYIMCYKYVL